MYQHKLKLFAILMVMACQPLFLSAQETAPYSRYGVGELESRAFSASQGMGGLTAAYRNTIFINSVNPASYSSLNLATLDVGIQGGTKNITSGDNSTRTGDGFIDYIALAFPVRNIGALTFGLNPYSKVSYSFEKNLSLPTGSDTLAYNNLFNGEGRTYELYMGFGGKLFTTDPNKALRDSLKTAKEEGDKIDTKLLNTRLKGVHSMSAGINANYFFGNSSYAEVISFEEEGPLNTRKTTKLRFSDFTLQSGLQYEARFFYGGKPYTRVNEQGIEQTINPPKKRARLVLGAYAHTPFKVGVKEETLEDRFIISNNSQAVVDTLELIEGERQQYQFPIEVGTGFFLELAGRFGFGADFSYSTWSQMDQLPGATNTTLTDSWRFASGAELTPNPEALRGLFKRMTYRFGGYFNKGHIDIDGTTIDEYGITFGWSIPVASGPGFGGRFVPFSRLNFSFVTGSRGTTANGLTQETFFRAYVGLTLNDKWFIKRKYF